MNEAEPPQRSEAELREEARTWFVRQRQPMSAAEMAAFRAWIEADPAHDRAFCRIEEIWRATEGPAQRLAARDSDALSVYLNALDRAKARPRTSRALVVASLLLLLAVAGAAWIDRPNLVQDMMADHVTGRGERRALVLSDGSRVLLDADSALNERFSGTERRVVLLRGMASFDIAPGTRPFVAAAADGEIHDIGTRFDVGLVDEGALVTLESGKVAVSTPGAGRPVTLEPGERLRFGRHGAGPVEKVALADALAWRGGRYVFYREHLSDVVAEVARYRRGRIVVLGGDLGDRLVTGSFPLSDTDAALSSLQSSVGFRMTSVTGALTVIRR